MDNSTLSDSSFLLSITPYCLIAASHVPSDLVRIIEDVYNVLDGILVMRNPTMVSVVSCQFHGCPFVFFAE